MSIVVRPVHTRRERRTFLTMPWRVFRGDPLWVPPIMADMEQRIDPQRGAWFDHGTAECFVAWREKEPVGTICCAIDPVRNTHIGRQECTFGFNHYLPDYRVAKALWDHACQWSRERNLDWLLGPFDLDREDAYGILVEGYDRPPTLLCGHTPPYYREFVTRYGFEPGREQNIALEADLKDANDPNGPAAKLHRAAAIVRKRGLVKVRSARLEDWDAEIDHIIDLLNQALIVLPDFSPWSRDGFEALAKEMKQFIDPDLILFAEVEGRCVGLVAGMPNLNQVLIHANGLRTPLNKLTALWAMRKRPKCICMKSILVLPAYWNHGVAALMLDEFTRLSIEKGYDWVDMSITGAENPMTPRLATRLGARIYKRWQVYAKRVASVSE